MPQHRVIADKDGRMRTVDTAPPKTAAEMERFRRAVHDHISGNTEPWHDDPHAAPKPPAEPDFADSEFHLIHQGWYA